MKNHLKKYTSLGLLSLALLATSCDDFLTRPTTDDFVADSFYKNETQCKQAVNTLYGCPWMEWQRGMLAVGDALAGNYYKGSTDAYTNLTISGAASDDNLVAMSNSLWSVIGHANMTIENLNRYATDVSDEIRNKYVGEAMVIKSAAYFYLVRAWGAIPIVHDNKATIESGDPYALSRYKLEDVYKYIIATLVQAAEYLPETNDPGRVDRTSAYGMLCKVYLTAAGVGGTLNNHYLEKSLEYGKKVYEDKNHPLEPEYANLFRISTGDNNAEGLFTTHWNATYDPYTSINMQHCDLAPGGSFNGTANNWGAWSGPTVDLLNLFGEDPFVIPGTVRSVSDPRRLSIATMYHDIQPYWYRKNTNAVGSKGFYVSTWGAPMGDEWGAADFESSTGACNGSKCIHGNLEDHVDECGVMPQEQGSNTPIHYLRAADVYLCMAEADLLLNGSVSGDALAAFNAVRERAKQTAISSPTYDDIWNERRKELAFEGDNWFDYVKRSYYNDADAAARLASVERGAYENISLKDWYNNTADDNGTKIQDAYGSVEAAKESALKSNKSNTVPTNQSGDRFTIPFPENDLLTNPKLAQEPANYDFEANIDYYDESKY